MRTNFKLPDATCPSAPAAECIVLATIRPDWFPPTPLDGYVLAVHHTGDGWYSHYYRELDGDCIDIVGDIGWPFVEDVAHAADWEAAGFEVI